MLRVYKHDDPRKRRDAAKFSRIKYEMSGKREEAFFQKKTKQRLDRVLIERFEDGDESGWAVHRLTRLCEPPLPSDVMERWSQEHQRIACKFTKHPSFLWAFDRGKACMDEIGWWIRDPPFRDSSFFEGRLMQYSDKSVKKMVDGWYVRDIIESFVNRWSGLQVAGKDVDRVELYKSTEAAIDRMCVLLKGLRELTEWSYTHDFRIAKQGNSLRFKITEAVRIWKYQELCLLRAELFDQYRLKVSELVAHFQRHNFHWQSCWFQQNRLHQSISNRFRRCLAGQVLTGVEFDNSSDSSSYCSDDDSAWSM